MKDLPEGIADEVRRRHGAHTVLLYGSRARGDSNDDSDVDLVAVRATGGSIRDVEAWRGFAIDLHVHDEAGVPALIEQRASALRDARTLVQEGDWGDRILQGVRTRLEAPPPKMPADERAALWAWGEKMRLRLRAADPALAAYQRAVLLVEILPSWAEIRRRWFFGGKATLRLLEDEDPVVGAAYKEALVPGAPLQALTRLLDAVFDRRFFP